MKVTITLNGGEKINAEVPNFNATEITEKMNDSQITVINVGDIVLGKHSVMMIAPYVAPTEPVV